LDVADVEASAAVDAGSSTHQFLQQDVSFECDIEDSVNGELLDVLVKLTLGPWETVQDDSLRGLWLLDLLVNDLHNDFVTDKTASLDDASDGFNEVFVKTAADSALEDFPDLITCGDVIVVEVFSEEFSISSLSDSGCSEEEEEFLLGS
jgi:hypothetical protein